MNLFKQKSFSLGVFLSHLLLPCPILAILILQQSCDIIHCYSLLPKLLLSLSGCKGVGIQSTVIDIQGNAFTSNISRSATSIFKSKDLTDDYTSYV